MQQHLFVCGCARSGTSSLTRILNRHPDIFIGMERYIRLFFATRRLTPDLFTADRFLDVRTGDTFYDRLDHFKGYADAAARLGKARFVGDKIPKLYEAYSTILSDMPDAKFVFIVRNVFDVATSYKRRATDESDAFWGRQRGVTAAVDDWSRSLQCTLDARTTGRVHVVQFEDLILENRGFESLCEFLGFDVTADVGPLPPHKRNPNRKEISLTPEEKRFIALNADFESYRRLLDHPNEIRKQRRSAKPTRLMYKYRTEDGDIIDYDFQEWEGCSFAIRRTPHSGVEGATITCLGSAATFGRFVTDPYPTRLSRTLGARVTNFGFGGARFETFLKEPAIIRQCAESDVVVLELMSARGNRTDLFKPWGHLGAMGVPGEKYADRVYRDLPKTKSAKPGGGPQQPQLFVDRVYDWAARHLDWEELQHLRHQLLESYVTDGIRLIREIGRPVVLLWFSQRSLDREPCPGSLDSWSCGFPHFVDRTAVDALRAHAADLVEVVSTAGLPSRLTARETGEPVAMFRWQTEPDKNIVYPSAEMHQEAADRLAPAINVALQAIHDAVATPDAVNA